MEVSKQSTATIKNCMKQIAVIAIYKTLNLATMFIYGLLECTSKSNEEAPMRASAHTMIMFDTYTE